MEYTIQHLEDRKIVIATAKGEWESQMDNTMIRELMETVASSGSRNILMDMRELLFNFPLVQIFERAQEMRELRSKHEVTSAKVALVYPSKDKKIEDDLKFFETAARNRGLPYRAFKDVDEAMAWLTE